MENKAKKIIIVLPVVLFFICSSRQEARRAAALEHGTTDRVIEENMLKDTPPADYQIDESMQGDAKDGIYNGYFLKDRLQTVSIDIDEDNLNYLFQNAEQKPSVMTNSVTIGDKTIGYTGLKTKGNYTLSHTFTDNAGSDRFSFTINFGKYVKKKNGYSKRQNFYGCNKISFNNFFFDKSMMKEYIAMKLMSEMGVPAPQYGLAKLYINGGYYGVYFMVEALDSSIMEQYLGKNDSDVSDYITKPENTTLEYDNSMDKFIRKDGTFDLSPVLVQDAEGNYQAKGKLKEHTYFWEDDANTLQDVAGMLPVAFGWQKKLAQLSKGKDFDGKKIDVESEEYLELLSQVIDVDEALRYFATHSFLVQIDNMFVEQHNMGLYIGTDGKSMFLPWDYDLCFGCYYPSTSETTANMDIDLMYKDNSIAFSIYEDSGSKKPVPDYSSFPFFQVIYQNSVLMEKYHQYMMDCSVISALGGETSDGRQYKSGWFSSCISAIEEELLQAAGEKLAANVYYLNGAAQPDDVEFALPNLKQIIALRSLGVMLQVDGIDALAGGYGCGLDALGNAMPGQASNTGNIAVIDADTGIYSMADYGDSWTNEPPLLTITGIEPDDPLYQHIKESLDMAAGTFLKVAVIINTGKPEGEHRLYIPAVKGEEIKSVYAFTEENGLEELEVKKEKSAYSISSDTNICLVIIYNGLGINNVADNNINTADKSGETVQEVEGQSLKWVMAAVMAVVIVAAALIIMKKQKKE